MGTATRFLCLCASVTLAFAVSAAQISPAESKTIMRRIMREEKSNGEARVHYRSKPEKHSEESSGGIDAEHEREEASNDIDRDTEESLFSHDERDCSRAGKFAVSAVILPGKIPGVPIPTCSQSCVDKDPADVKLEQDECSDETEGTARGRWKHLASNKFYAQSGTCGFCKDISFKGKPFSHFYWTGWGFLFKAPDNHQSDLYVKTVPEDYLGASCDPSYVVFSNMCYGVCSSQFHEKSSLKKGRCQQDTMYTTYVETITSSTWLQPTPLTVPGNFESSKDWTGLGPALASSPL